MALITASELSSLSRTSYIDDTKSAAYIEEAEQCDVRKHMGDKLFEYITENSTNQDLATLMNGGYYDVQCGNDTDRRYHPGLKRTLAYYTYARLVTGGTIELTRVGVVDRDSNYSHHTDLKNRQQASRETAAIADEYMSQVLDYCRHNNTLKAYTVPAQRPNSSRTIINIIGQ